MARELAERALAIARELGHPREEARALRVVGQSSAAMGEIDAARRAFVAAAAAAESGGGRFPTTLWRPGSSP